jgi:hypothetical protein
MMPDYFRILLQGNLKAFTGVSHTPDLIDELALAICEHHTALEHLCLQQQFNAWSVITSSLLQQPDAQGLRAFPVSVLTACQSDAFPPAAQWPACIQHASSQYHQHKCAKRDEITPAADSPPPRQEQGFTCLMLHVPAGGPGFASTLHWRAGY